MKNLLPLGSVVRLNKGELKIMIISRLPLYNNEGTIGYFDYAACVYPTGQADQQLHFFNEEDIAVSDGSLNMPSIFLKYSYFKLVFPY